MRINHNDLIKLHRTSYIGLQRYNARSLQHKSVTSNGFVSHKTFNYDYQQFNHAT